MHTDVEFKNHIEWTETRTDLRIIPERVKFKNHIEWTETPSRGGVRSEDVAFKNHIEWTETRTCWKHSALLSLRGLRIT